MPEQSIKEKTVSGLFWKFAESVGNQLLSLLISVILARILMPEDYGIIAIVMVFISFFQVLVVNGLGSPLIQKKDADDIDFSTIFYTSILLGLFVYVLIYLGAPYVACFYNSEILTPVLRVMGLSVIITSFNAIQHAYVSRHMLFKKFFFSTLIGRVCAGLLGIYLAYNGYGVWALVVQSLMSTFTDMIVLYVTVRWKPLFVFSVERLKSLWSFGWKIILAASINEIYQDIRTLLIGKVYTKSDLSYFNQGKNIPELLVNNINKSIVTVVFPAIATVQDNESAVKTFVRRGSKVSSFILFPLLIGLALVAEPLVKLVLTEKWLPCVPYMQIMCLTNCLTPISSISQQAIKAVGRSDITLYQELIKKSVGIAIVIATLRISVMAVVLGVAVVDVWCFIVNTFPARKVLNYSYREQLVDLMPNIICTIIMAIGVYFITFLNLPILVELIIQIVLGGSLYYTSSKILKNENLEYLINTLRNNERNRERSI